PGAPAEPGRQIAERHRDAKSNREESQRRTRREAEAAALEELFHGLPMLAARRTLRRDGHSAAGLAVMTAADASPRPPDRQVPGRDDHAARHRDLAGAEVRHEDRERSSAPLTHVRTIAR